MTTTTQKKDRTMIAADGHEVGAGSRVLLRNGTQGNVISTVGNVYAHIETDDGSVIAERALDIFSLDTPTTPTPARPHAKADHCTSHCDPDNCAVQRAVQGGYYDEMRSEMLGEYERDDTEWRTF